MFTSDDHHLRFLQLSQYPWEKKTQHFFRDEIQAFPMAMGQKHVKSQSGIPWCSPARMMDHQAGSRGMNYVSYAVPLFQR
jgi:hypothetical protein